MEGGDPHIVCSFSHQRAHSLFHLTSSFIGESDGQNLIGPDVHLFHHIGNTVGQHSGLTRACSGKNEKWSFYGGGGLILLFV